MQGIASFILNVLLFIVIFSSILFIAYVATKYIGKKSHRVMNGKYINIVDSISLGMDKQLYIVKAGEQYLLIASSGKNIELLSNINIDISQEALLDIRKDDGLLNFKGILEKYIDTFKFKKGGNNKVILKESIFSSNLDKLRKHNKDLDKKNVLDGEHHEETTK